MTPSGKTNRLIFFGTEDFSAASLQALIDGGYTIAAVVTKPDRTRGRGHKLIPPAVKTIALTHHIPVWQPTTLSDITDDIKALQPVAGVLVSFGKLIPQAMIDLFTPGIINVHPSKLPTYRGPSPIESAILNGDSATGVSIMQLSSAMDAGPIYHFSEHRLRGDETQSELYHRLAQLGADSLVQVLPAILDGTLQPQPQDDSRATYCHLLTKADGVINWQTPAARLEREIRAYHTWPQSRTSALGDIEVIITQAHVLPLGTRPQRPPGTVEVHEREQTAAVHTTDGLLAIDRLKPIGKKEMPIAAFLRGYQTRLR